MEKTETWWVIKDKDGNIITHTNTGAEMTCWMSFCEKRRKKYTFDMIEPYQEAEKRLSGAGYRAVRVDVTERKEK